MTVRRRAVLPVVAVLTLALAGCGSPASPSTLTVAFELDGEARTVTLHPEATCDDSGVAGLSTGQGGPEGQFNFSDRALDGSLGRGYGGIDDGPGLVTFEAAQIDLDRDDPAVVDVGETPVSVVVFADRAESGPDYDPDDGEQVDGTLTAHLVCAVE